jgi:hypothetical protein
MIGNSGPSLAMPVFSGMVWDAGSPGRAAGEINQNW